MATRAPGPQLREYVHGDYLGYTERTDTTIRRREFAVPFIVLVLEFGPPIHGCHPSEARPLVTDLHSLLS